MITLFNILTMLTTISLIKSSNPIKMGFTILIFSLLIFVKLSLLSGLTWSFSIMFLLFMGGILVLFMVISSLMPNSRSKKTKLSLATVILGLVILTCSNGILMETVETKMKLLIINKIFMVSILLIMACYFFCFLELLSKSQNPMRSYNCR